MIPRLEGLDHNARLAPAHRAGRCARLHDHTGSFKSIRIIGPVIMGNGSFIADLTWCIIGT
jgi:hypothetical protein